MEVHFTVQYEKVRFSFCFEKGVHFIGSSERESRGFSFVLRRALISFEKGRFFYRHFSKRN